jgi:cobyrinic acid a,c-diamide synthase
VAIGVMRALTARGMSVAPFKIGPDYIDPSHHRAAAGRAARALDTWMLSSEAVRGVFARGAAAADIAIIEGVMGLFDGRAGPPPNGSTAEVATLLAAPIILVLDARAMAQTAGAIALGLTSAVPGVRIAGVIANRVAGAAHAGMCRTAIEDVARVPMLGWLPRDESIGVPERHLGLAQAEERTVDFDRLVALVNEHIDVDALLAIARGAPTLDEIPAAPPTIAPTRQAVIGVARDAAFSFYYEDSLDLLRAYGAEIRFFSPLTDSAPPADAGLLYFGGGYPELHAEALAANASMREAVKAFAESGRPIYAECGGLMYLCQDMVGIIPARAEMTERLTLGYRELEVLGDSPLAVAGQRLRGHEFHYSKLVTNTPMPPAYRMSDGRQEGFLLGNVLASYVHVHLGSDPRLAERLVTKAR